MAEPVVTSKPMISDQFIDRLEGLVEQRRLGDLAILRRNAGRSVGESRGAIALFYRLLPARLGSREEIYFLVATLFPWNIRQAAEGNFGTSMAQLRQKTDSESIDRRMTILLDADYDTLDERSMRPGELGFRLRQAVKLLASHEIRVNWRRLLVDLLNWSHPDRWVQKTWAREYFGVPAKSHTDED